MTLPVLAAALQVAGREVGAGWGEVGKECSVQDWGSGSVEADQIKPYAM